ncbi:MAG: methyltransferase family protein [Candidatus Zhuqueibacterota bacterium]
MTLPTKLFAFVILTIILITISRPSLGSPRSHGFYRFFAWESIVILFLLNVNIWFHQPLAWYQLVSWFFLFASFVPLVYGVRTLVGRGKPVPHRETEPHLLAFEKTSELVTSGIYRYIRHPLYSSLLLLVWGIFFKSMNWHGFGIAAAASLFLFATARADEQECIRYFGPTYQTYMKQSKRFIPFLF